MRHASLATGMYRVEEAGEGKRGSDPVRERSHGNLLSRARAFAELARYETYAFLFACSLSSKNRPHPRRVAGSLVEFKRSIDDCVSRSIEDVHAREFRARR